MNGKMPANLNGTWTVAIEPHGSYVIQDHVPEGGRPGGLRRQPTVGRYTWSPKGKRLTLKPIKDMCNGRRVVLTSPLTKVS